MLSKSKQVATAAKASEKKENAPQANAPGENFPLFFKKPQVITLDRHVNAKIRNNITMAFSNSTNSVPLNAADIVEAAKCYPLAFTQDDVALPVAILGLEQQNYFVDQEGKWKEGCYIPSYVRKYPFIFMEVPNSDQLTLCIDEEAVTFDAKAEGMKLYEGENPSAFTKSALEFCGAFQEQHRYVRGFSDLLKQKGMLSPQRSDVELANGRKISLAGFQSIDREKLAALPEVEVFDWFKRGYLALAFYILQSQSNWRQLLDLANKREGNTDKKEAGVESKKW